MSSDDPAGDQDGPEPTAARPTHANRQAVMHCPYCAEETIFPLEKGWECRSCLRAFSVTFLGLRSRDRDRQEKL